MEIWKAEVDYRDFEESPRNNQRHGRREWQEIQQEFIYMISHNLVV